MSHEPLPTSPVKLVTAAYLEQSFQSAEPAQKAAHPLDAAPPDSVILPILKVVPSLLVCLVVIAIPVSLFMIYAKEKDRRTCGVDWILWAFGSDKTFESIMTRKLEQSRRDMESIQAESRFGIKPFDLKQLNFQSGQWNQSRTTNRR